MSEQRIYDKENKLIKTKMSKLRFQIISPETEEITDECPLCGNPKYVKFSNCEECRKKWGIQIQFNDLQKAKMNSWYEANLETLRHIPVFLSKIHKGELFPKKNCKKI